MSARTTKALLDAAVKLFAAQGYGMTSMQQLTDEAGVTKGALYHHFSGKEDLLRRIHDEITTGVLTVLRPVLEAGGPPVPTLKALIRAHVGAMHSMGDAIGVVARERRAFGPENWQAIRAQRKAVERPYVDTIEAGQRDGVFRTDVDARVMAYGVLGMLGSIAEWYRPNGEVPIQDIARMYGETVVAGLLANS
jgi:AcrR family transcriptional regulator